MLNYGALSPTPTASESYPGPLSQPKKLSPLRTKKGGNLGPKNAILRPKKNCLLYPRPPYYGPDLMYVYLGMSSVYLYLIDQKSSIVMHKKDKNSMFSDFFFSNPTLHDSVIHELELHFIMT